MLTLGEAFATLGLAEGTPYEAVLAAKNRLLEKSSDDFQRRMEVGVGRAGCKEKAPAKGGVAGWKRCMRRLPSAPHARRPGGCAPRRPSQACPSPRSCSIQSADRGRI